jgi:hypothetical protein
MKITRTIGGAAIAACIALGGASASFAASTSTSTTTPTHGVAERLCNREPAMQARIAAQIARLQTRLTRLTDARAKADAAGKTAIVAHIDKRIAQVNDHIALLHKRADKLTAAFTEHCS